MNTIIHLPTYTNYQHFLETYDDVVTQLLKNAKIDDPMVVLDKVLCIKYDDPDYF